MSERTAPALEKIDLFLPVLKARPAAPEREQLIEETEALRRAVAAFHMEAIRFRMHNVDRLIKLTGEAPATREAFDHVRQALETAGFHTRSHAAPEGKPASS
jgi:hypothetical protein